MSGSDARALSRSLLDLCRMRKLTIATAESCTGGLVAGALTDIPGSSDVIDRGFVTYSNDAKRILPSPLPASPVREVRHPASRWASCISRSPPATAGSCIANAASVRSAVARCASAPWWRPCAC